MNFVYFFPCKIPGYSCHCKNHLWMSLWSERKKVGIMRLEGGIFLGLIWGSSQVLGSFWGRDHFSAIPIIQHSGLHTTNSAIWSVPYTCAQPCHC